MPKKANSLFFIILCILIIGTNNSLAQVKINIDDNWKFTLGHAADASKDFNYSIATIFSKTGAAPGTAIDPTFNDSNWQSITIPHDWAVALPFKNHPDYNVEAHGYKPIGGNYPTNSIGWYRKKFNVAPADSGNRFQLQFDGIFRNASIWVNGFFIGTNASGYIGKTYDVTDVVNYQTENTITIRVDATQYEGWFYEGAGIYRHVWLLKTNNIFIPQGGVFVHANVQGKNATVTTQTTIENKNNLPTTCNIQTTVTTRDGKLVAQTKATAITILNNSNITVNNNLVVNNVQLWQIENPYLYRVVTTIKQNNKIIALQKERFGIRTIKFDAENGFFLNNKPLKILGTNNHQDHAGLGSALPNYLQYYRIQQLKNMGSNAYRTSHHAPTPELLDACDSLGMLVMDEQRLLNSSDEYIDQFTRLIKRDRNHASIFMWSIGNEEGWVHTQSNGKRIAQTLIALQQKLDPTRTCTYAADVANVFNGVNEVIPIRGFNYRQFAVADYHKSHPTQPIIGTEMGSTVTTRGVYKTDSINAYLPDQDITAPWWASTAETWWKLCAENKYWQGGFIWTGFDYRGEPTPFKWPNISSHFGVMDACGYPKNIYYYYQSWWTNKDVLHISPHWTWKPKQQDSLIEVWVNSNAQQVELFLNQKSLGQKNMPPNGHLQWAVPYQPGTLEAVGIKNGKKIIAKVVTTTEPFEIIITPSKTFLTADNEDAVVLNITVLDSLKRKVPNANNLINFTINNNATIIGVGNGDPSCHQPDKCENNNWQRSLFNGKCQVIIQGNYNVGNIVFKAFAIGLTPATVTIKAIKE